MRERAGGDGICHDEGKDVTLSTMLFLTPIPPISQTHRSLMKDERMESNKKRVVDVSELEEDFM